MNSASLLQIQSLTELACGLGHQALVGQVSGQPAGMHQGLAGSPDVLDEALHSL